MTLPLRPREECTEAFKEEPSSGDENNLFTRKRRASSVAGPSIPAIPVRGGLSQLFSARNNETGLSDAEYEIVEAPTPDQEASDSETDLISFVKVKPVELASEISLTLPIRAREPADGATTSTNARSDESDSDWSLV